jgi:uncharacterized membrane protein (DUF2068 family)
METEKIEEEYPVSKAIVIYELISAILEMSLGIGVLLFGRKAVEVYKNFRAQELLENPHDLIVRITERIVPYIFDHRGYVILVLLGLSIAKLVGAVGLLKKKRWGSDLLMGLIVFVLPFQVYSFIIRPTWVKAGYLTVGLLIAIYLGNIIVKRFKRNI